MTIPSGLTRSDVTVSLDYETFGKAKFTLRNKTGKKLSTVIGETKGNPIYLKTTPKGADPTGPGYQMVIIHGVTEIIKNRPYREHEDMVQNGRIVALFYVIDDPAEKKEVLAASGVQ